MPFIDDAEARCSAITAVAERMKISKQTVKKILYLYLSYQNIGVLAPKKDTTEKALTKDQKNMRWALNKFFYTKRQNSLKTAYTLMLKEKYCDESGKLKDSYPSIHQFRYFYSKHKSLQKYYISRNGIKDYQRNNRPLLGEGTEDFAPNIGTGMLDATICDIYLVNESGSLVGRPILTACIDAYSGLCCGYTLTWEGGNYSLRGLMISILADKVKLCSILIKQEIEHIAVFIHITKMIGQTCRLTYVLPTVVQRAVFFIVKETAETVHKKLYNAVSVDI